MLDWVFGSSMVWVLLCCGDNAVPIAKYKEAIDCHNAQKEIMDWSRISKASKAGEKDNTVFNACIKVERLIGR